MAKSTRQYVFEGMEVLPAALTPFVEKRLESALTGHWQVRVAEKLRLHAGPNGKITWDQATLLNAIDRFWSDAFKNVLGRAERSIVNELVAVRNKLSHNETFTYDDAERALDSMRRLMEAIGAGVPAERLGKMRDTILRTRFTELQRNEERRKTQRLVEISVDTAGGLLPWREVVEPHQDVATGEFLQAEFAADLGKVHAGSAPSEYANPREFFGRTYLTDGLGALLVGNDAKGIAPGSNLLETIFRKCSPCLILIDEWVAYLRQIYKVDGLPSGSFDANLSFVQSLTEAVKTSPGTLLVAALPASQIEVGGEGGQEALVRLKQTFSRGPGGRGQLPTRGSHGSGRAPFGHPAPQIMVSLLNGTHCARRAQGGGDRC